jgi:uncharacterized protein
VPGAELVLVAGLAVFVGAVVQGAAGFGLGLVAAPVVALLDPSLVPVTLLVVTAALPVMAVAREVSHVDWRGVGWAMLGRLPGTVLGAWLVVALPPRAIAVGVALSVLAGVGASVVRWAPVPARDSLLVAGFLSGTAGTATSIGGPPIALLYQHSAGPVVRATLSAFFFCGIVVSLSALALAGQVEQRSLLTGLLLLPAMLAGFAASGPLRRVVDAGRTRGVVLWLVTASALVLLVRSLQG